MSADFVAFCQQHGLVIEHTPPIGRWMRFKTTDKRHKQNGAVKFLGEVGFCINWATMEKPALWHARSNQAAAVDFERVRREAAIARAEAARRNQHAAQRAASMLEKARQDYHPYLARKGFPKHCAAVLDDALLIPMFAQGSLCGLQVIHEDGNKRFLPGQRCSGAYHLMGSSRGVTVLCEGYATALSALAVFAALKQTARVVVGFSAGNLQKLAANLPRGIVLADNDASGTGLKVAKQTGWPYWISDRQGEDFNDAQQRLGNLPLAMQLTGVIQAI